MCPLTFSVIKSKCYLGDGIVETRPKGGAVYLFELQLSSCVLFPKGSWRAGCVLEALFTLWLEHRLSCARAHTHTYTCVLQLHVSLTVLHHGVQKGGRLCCSLQLRPGGLRISLASPWKRSHSTLVLMMTKRRPPWTVWSRSSAGFWPDFSVSNTWRWADAVFVAFRGMWFVHRRSGSSCSSPFWRRTARRSWWSSSLPACLSNITMSCSTTLTFLSWPSMWVSFCLSCFHLQEQLL